MFKLKREIKKNDRTAYVYKRIRCFLFNVQGIFFKNLK